MGRGRAKAKQTKVARELKYRGPSTDLDALRAELSGSHGDESHRPDESSDTDDLGRFARSRSFDDSDDDHDDRS